MKYVINSTGDLMMSHKGWVGKEVTLVKVCKSGLYMVQREDGETTTVPKRNLDKLL